MKIVLDTNVVVSGLLKLQGHPADILALALTGAIQICHDQHILAEYTKVLPRPRFKFEPKRVREVLAKLEVDGLPVDASKFRGLNLPDPFDEPFLAVALAGSVDYLVTGNLVHFPEVRRQGCPVVSPAEFMTHWQKAKSP